MFPVLLFREAISKKGSIFNQKKKVDLEKSREKNRARNKQFSS